MGIFMTLNAVCSRNSLPILKQRTGRGIQSVTCGAIRLLVLTLQGESGPAVIEPPFSAKITEPLFGMAFVTMIQEPVLVWISVACTTL